MNVIVAILAILAIAALGLFLALRQGSATVVHRGAFLEKRRLVSDEPVFPPVWEDPGSLGGLGWSTVPVRTLVCFSDGRTIELPGDIDIPYPPGTEIEVYVNSFGRFWVASAPPDDRTETPLR